MRIYFEKNIEETNVVGPEMKKNWTFTELYEAILENQSLVEAELVELKKLMEKKIEALHLEDLCRNPRIIHAGRPFDL